MADYSTATLAAWRRRHWDWRLSFGLPVMLLALAAALYGGTGTLGYDYMNLLASPSPAHPMGTDELGRDILQRLVESARISMFAALASAALAAGVGSVIGLVVAYIGGRLEATVGAAADILISLPDIFFAILVMSLIAPSQTILVVTIGTIYTPQFVRLVMAVTQSAKRQDFVLAARSLGASAPRIIFSDILPNIFPLIIVKLTLTISSAMLLESSLSFLGLGSPPPASSWGQMVGSLKPFINNNFWPILFPTLTIFLVIMAVNLLGDWLQDYVNPEVKR
jgi:peptide/nickel transport system permease protein